MQGKPLSVEQNNEAADSLAPPFFFQSHIFLPELLDNATRVLSLHLLLSKSCRVQLESETRLSLIKSQ